MSTLIFQKFSFFSIFLLHERFKEVKHALLQAVLQYKKRKKQEKIQKIAKKSAFPKPGPGNLVYFSPSTTKTKNKPDLAKRCVCFFSRQNLYN